MSMTAILALPLTYGLGLLLVAGGAATYILSRLRLLLVNLWLRLTTGRPLDILSGMDATLQYSSASYFTQPECPTVITVGMTFAGTLDITAFQKRCLEKVVRARDSTSGRLLNPRWTHRVERRFGLFAWVRDGPFDIKEHVRVLDEPYADSAALVKLIERISHRPLPTGRPPWEFLVVPKMAAAGADDECAVVYRVHHSLADGLGLVVTCHALVDEESPEGASVMVKPENKEKAAELAKRNPLLHFLANPSQKWSMNAVADVLWNLLAIALAAPYLVAKISLQKPERNALHGPELSGRKLLAVSNDIQFQLLKDIALAFNCCINDVFHYGVIGALQKCNEESPEAPVDSHTTLLVPLHLLRPNSPWTQNGFTFAFMRYAFRGESPQHRLRDVAAVTNEVKSSPGPLLNFAITHALSNHMPLAIAKKCLAPSFDYTAMATNVVGPSKEISVLGVPITNMFFFPINHGRAGVSFSMITLKGCVRLTVTVDRAVAMDDNTAQCLVDHFESEVQSLHKLVLEHGQKLLNNFWPPF